MIASIQEIKNVEQHPNADKLDLVTILGWQCVVKRDEFKVGDKCCYIEIDSVVMPKEGKYPEWAEFLANRSYKIKTTKIRGIYSQGLCLPLQELGIDGEIDTDISNVLGIEHFTKMEPGMQSPKNMNPFPSGVGKTDETNIQSNPKLLNSCIGETLVVTLKMDGTSCTITNVNDKIEVCSRNLTIEKDESIYWQMFEKYNFNSFFDKMKGTKWAFQGEICGPVIQKNPIGLEELHFYIFNIKDLTNNTFYSYDEIRALCGNLGFEYVPFVTEIEIEENTTLEDLKKLTEDIKYQNGKLAEGLVFRFKCEQKYNRFLGKVLSFKVLNPKYLIKHGE